MMKFVLVVLLPLSVIFHGTYSSYLNVLDHTPEAKNSGTLETLRVAGGSVTMEIDLNRLDRSGVNSNELKNASFQFDAATDSFFSIKVYNGELRGPLPGSLTLTAKSSADLPSKFFGSARRLALEFMASGEAADLVIRDAKTGFTYFYVEGNTFDYGPVDRVFRLNDGRLLVSQEFAEQLARPGIAGSIVGSISMIASMRQTEISQIADGEVVSDSLPALGGPETGTVPGPDVVVGDLNGLAQFGNSSGTQVGLAVGTDSCNFGTVDLDWFALPNNDHPVIPQNLYRMNGGASNDERFEQIGQSNVKHAFQALTENICGLGCNGVGSTHLGSGCSDPYVASLNAGSSGNSLGSRAWINPFTGAFPRGDSATPPNTHTSHSHTGTSHRILTEMADLNTSLNVGAKYYAEAEYITPHEYAWCQANPTQCNQYNNVSYRRYTVSGTSSPFAFGTVAGEGTVSTKAAVNAWPGATLVEIKPDPGNDGIGIVAYKITNPSPGVWHYEYAVYNQNLDRAIQSFAVPLGGGNIISNIGFHAPPQHPGWTFDGTVGNAGFSSTPWTPTQSASAITWDTQTFAENANANAIRWGTLYNFRFDSNKPPQAANATVGFFKTGSPMSVAIMAPGGPAANISISGRVTSAGFRSIGLVKITLTELGGASQVTYTNSFGYYRFDNIAGGVTYTIAASKLRHTFSSKQIAANDDLTNVNFISGQ